MGQALTRLPFLGGMAVMTEWFVFLSAEGGRVFGDEADGHFEIEYEGTG